MTFELICACPVCGGKADWFEAGDSFAYFVQCEKCGYKSALRRTPKEAIDKWNEKGGDKT